jgi:hypothetical protein
MRTLVGIMMVVFALSLLGTTGCQKGPVAQPLTEEQQDKLDDEMEKLQKEATERVAKEKAKQKAKEKAKQNIKDDANKIPKKS